MSKKNPQLESLRRNYTQASLDADDLLTNPIDQFKQWMKDALDAKIIEPNAMTLSTINQRGRPSARVVLLKEITKNSFVFYTNYDSAKANDIDNQSEVSLTFLWKEIERQVRINGHAQKISEAKSIAYFQSRPRASQLGAWASDQSETIPNREYLEEKMKSAERKFEAKDSIDKPHNWGGYEVLADEIEFWQGRSSRLHDRHLYTKMAVNQWNVRRLSP